jgi:hypothetical protein
VTKKKGWGQMTKCQRVAGTYRVQFTLVLVFLSARAGLADTVDYHLGNMAANRVLFLGNSICLSGKDWWGLTASAQEKDYVHLVARSIEARTGGTLRLHPQGPEDIRPDGTYSSGADANIVNIADVFERAYATYPGSGRLSWQLAWKPDIVVLQFGENVPSTGFDPIALKAGLKTLVAELKNSGNPNIFLTSAILGATPAIDAIKQEIVAEDPRHRVFVDLSGVRLDPLNIETVYHHPSDQGMQVIADSIFDAMVVHSVPEPGCVAMASSAMLCMALWIWRRR